MEYISLASGASYFNSPEAASEAAVSAILNHKTFYAQPEGTAGLRKAIAHRYKTLNQATVSPEQILITPGTKFALYNVLHQILKPGDEVIAPVPNWTGFHEVLDLLQAKLVYLPTKPADNYEINPDILQKLITSKTRLFLFSNPSNPTGKIYQKTEIGDILEVLRQHPDIYVLSDEIYDLVTFDKRVPSLTEFHDPIGRHLIVNGFSKSFAMSGWRVGYLVVPPALLPVCTKFQNITFSGVSEFVQDAAQAVIASSSEILNPILQTFTLNRKIISNFLKKENIPCFFPEAAYYVFPDFSAFFNQEVPDSITFARYLHQQFNLEIQPGEYYGAPGFARLSFAIRNSELETALARLAVALQSLKKKNISV